jgi:hypothetical protein
MSMYKFKVNVNDSISGADYEYLTDGHVSIDQINQIIKKGLADAGQPYYSDKPCSEQPLYSADTPMGITNRIGTLEERVIELLKFKDDMTMEEDDG